MNRLECAGEVVRHTLNILAVVAPDWLRENSQPEWIDRYGPRVEDARLPKNEKLRQAHAWQIGLDGYSLLDNIYAEQPGSSVRPMTRRPTTKKRTTSWVGYKVHLTETCEEGTPHLITHVETTAAPVADGEVTTRIHENARAEKPFAEGSGANGSYVRCVVILDRDESIGTCTGSVQGTAFRPGGDRAVRAVVSQLQAELARPR
jgi:hypothetical protein